MSVSKARAPRLRISPRCPRPSRPKALARRNLPPWKARRSNLQRRVPRPPRRSPTLISRSRFRRTASKPRRPLSNRSRCVRRLCLRALRNRHSQLTPSKPRRLGITMMNPMRMIVLRKMCRKVRSTKTLPRSSWRALSSRPIGRSTLEPALARSRRNSATRRKPPNPNRPLAPKSFFPRKPWWRPDPNRRRTLPANPRPSPPTDLIRLFSEIPGRRTSPPPGLPRASRRQGATSATADQGERPPGSGSARAAAPGEFGSRAEPSHPGRPRVSVVGRGDVPRLSPGGRPLSVALQSFSVISDPTATSPSPAFAPTISAVQ